MTTVDRRRLPDLGSAQVFDTPRFRRSTLANGVRVWTAAHRRAPVLTLTLLIPVGSADDPAHQPGLAALTADLLDEGTRDLTDVGLHEALTRIGAHLGIEVSSDATVLTVTTLPKYAAQAMSLLVDVAAHPRFDTADFDRVRDLRLSRMLQMRQAPSALADRALVETMYGSHPYGHLAIGTDASLRQIQVPDVVGFHARWYGPARWTLVAVGDCPDEELVDVARGELGEGTGGDSLPGGVSTARDGVLPPSVHRLVFVPRKGSVQSEVRLGHPGVSRTSPDYHALLVLNAVLGGQFISRINLNLREDKGYTYGARTSFDWRIGRGPFSFRSSVQTSATVDALIQAIKEIDEVRDARPVTEEELTVARAALTRGFPRSLETATQVARAGMSLALHGLQEDELSDFVDRVNEVDADTVVRAARTHLHPDQLLAVVVGSPDHVLTSLGRLGLGEPALID